MYVIYNIYNIIHNIMTPQISTITKLNYHPTHTFYGSQDHYEVSSKQILNIICLVLQELL